MQKLRELRNRRKMSQVELAEATGLTQAYISNLETGDRENPSRRVLELFATTLNCKVDDLLDINKTA